MVEEVDGVLEQVVVEVLIQMEQEVEGNFLGVEYLLGHDGKLINLAVFELPLDQGGIVEPRHEVLCPVATLPLVLRYYLLGLIIDEIDGSELGLAVGEVEGAEHGDRPEVEVVEQVVVVLLIKEKVGLPDGLGLSVNDKVVVGDSLLVGGLLLGLVGDADQAELPAFGLPQARDGHLHLGQVVGLPDRVAYLVGVEPALGVFAQVEAADLDLFVVAGAEPGDHRVVVRPPGQEFVGPLVVSAVELCHRLRISRKRVVVVAQHEAVVVVLPRLPYTEQTTLVESVQIAKITLLPKEVMVDI